MTQFEQAVCTALSLDGDAFRPVDGSMSQNYVNEYGQTKQLLEDVRIDSYILEQLTDKGENPNENDIERERDEMRRILVDYDIDEHANRFSEFFYVIDLI